MPDQQKGLPCILWSQTKSRPGIVPNEHLGGIWVQFRQKLAIKQGKRAKIASVWLSHVVPAGVVGDQRAREQVLRLHEANALEMPVDRLRPDAVEFDPGASAGGLFVDGMVALVLG